MCHRIDRYWLVQMLLSWQELKVPQAYTISQQIMSHGKVIKNRGSGQAHSLKVYMIFLLLSLLAIALSSLCLLCVFFCFSSSSSLPKPLSLSLLFVFPEWEMSVYTLWNSTSNSSLQNFIFQGWELQCVDSSTPVASGGDVHVSTPVCAGVKKFHLNGVKCSDIL